MNALQGSIWAWSKPVPWTIANILVMVLLTGIWCGREAISVWYAIYSFDRRTDEGELLQSSVSWLENRRNVQKHFSDTGLYISVEDIMRVGTNERSFDTLHAHVRKKCGDGNVLIWIPIKIGRPFAGEKVVELCLARQIH